MTSQEYQATVYRHEELLAMQLQKYWETGSWRSQWDEELRELEAKLSSEDQLPF